MDNSTKRLVALAEPLLILVVGIAIAFIVLAIMGPIFSLSTPGAVGAMRTRLMNVTAAEPLGGSVRGGGPGLPAGLSLHLGECAAWTPGTGMIPP